jgi:hypothetical protein
MATRPVLARTAPWIALAACAALVATLGARYRDLSRAYDRLREWAILPHAGFEVPAFSTSTLEGAPVTIGAAAAPRDATGAVHPADDVSVLPRDAAGVGAHR